MEPNILLVLSAMEFILQQSRLHISTLDFPATGDDANVPSSPSIAGIQN